MLKLENGMVLFQPCPLICAQKLIALSQALSTCWEGLGDVHAHFLEKLASFLGVFHLFSCTCVLKIYQGGVASLATMYTTREGKGAPARLG